jgi:hypothetical protein
MKVFLFTGLLTAATAGMALAGGGWHPYKPGSCYHNNSKHCVDARNAFAEHHNGMFPEQWDSQWYQGHRGRWVQHDKEWAWEGSNGDRYMKGKNGWVWAEAHEHHHHP